MVLVPSLLMVVVIVVRVHEPAPVHEISVRVLVVPGAPAPEPAGPVSDVVCVGPVVLVGPRSVWLPHGYVTTTPLNMPRHKFGSVVGVGAVSEGGGLLVTGGGADAPSPLPPAPVPSPVPPPDPGVDGLSVGVQVPPVYLYVPMHMRLAPSPQHKELPSSTLVSKHLGGLLPPATGLPLPHVSWQMVDVMALV